MKKAVGLTKEQMLEAEVEMKRQNGQVGGICAMAYDCGDELGMCALAALVLIESAPSDVLQDLFGTRKIELRRRVTAIVNRQKSN